MVSVLAADAECLIGIARILQDIIAGTLPHSLKPFLLSSTIIGLDKHNGTGIRPIAIGESFYRLACYKALRQDINSIIQILLPIQLGVSVSGGCEAIIINLNLVLEEGARMISRQTGSAVAALVIDFSNAFNTISREAVMKALYSHRSLSHLWSLVNYAYADPTDLYAQDDDHSVTPRLVSSEGVRQGDPLSALLFALGIHPVYKQTLSAHPNICGAAILDDFTMVGTPDELILAYQTLRDRSAIIHLKIQPDKSKLIYYHEDIDPLSSSVKNFLHLEGIQLVDTATSVLGAPVGLEEDRMKLVKQMVDIQIGGMKILLHDHLPAQEAIMLLRMSSNHKMDYLLRCVPPSIIQTQAARYDAAVIDTFTSKLDLSSQLANPSMDSQAIICQIQKPISDGGFGLTSAESLSHRAFISSVAATTQSSMSLTLFSPPRARHSPASTISSSSTLHAQVTNSLNHIQQQISSQDYNALLPQTTDAFFHEFGKKRRSSSSQIMYTSYGLQRDLSEALHKRQRTMLMDDITAIDNTEHE